MDESGAPGISENSRDYVGIALVLFESLAQAENAVQQIGYLRKELGLSADYEFHLARNSSVVQKEFIKLLTKLEFLFVFVAVPKDKICRYGAFSVLVQRLLIKLTEIGDKKIIIRMDDNPVLYREIRENSRGFGLRIACKQVHSKNYPLVQVADYVVGLATKELRGRRVDPNWQIIKRRKMI